MPYLLLHTLCSCCPLSPFLLPLLLLELDLERLQLLFLRGNGLFDRRFDCCAHRGVKALGASVAGEIRVKKKAASRMTKCSFAQIDGWPSSGLAAHER